MKLTKSKLKQIIKEEIKSTLNESQAAANVVVAWMTGGRSAAIQALEKTGVLECLRKSRATRGLADESLPADLKGLKKWLAMLPDECRRLLN